MLMRIFLLSFLLLSSVVRAEEPLEPTQAFRFSARVVDAQTIEARWQITDGYYMYREKFKFSLDGAKLGDAKLPPGKVKEDEIFGKVETYRTDVKILLPVSAAAGTVTLTAISQGCWDGGICYPPVTDKTSLSFPSAPKAGLTSVVPPASEQPATAVPPAPTFSPAVPSAAPVQSATGDETSRIAGLFKGDNLGLILVSFFGFGLLLSLTPCVFPMIPILSGIIVNHGHAVTHLRAFVLSLAYVLGMALTYAAVGVAAGLSGTLLSAALQNVWVLGGFALVFVVLSFSMFGFYELQMPAALQSRISDTANHQGGSLPAIAFMGALSALIVGPCVAAPLAGALLYIAQTGNAALGGTALFVMALGMGAPLLLVGAFSRSLLPKSGPWMEGVKKFFGIIMLATALWLVSPVLPLWAAMLGWALLLIIPSIYLHALEPLPTNARGMQRFSKGMGVVLLLTGAAMLAGVLGGAKDPLQPLGFLRSAAGATNSANNSAPVFQKVASVAELESRLKSSTQPVILDFYADWCVSCKEMERFTFADPQVAAMMGKFTLLKADVTANTEADKALLKRFGLFGPPGMIFFDRQGQEVGPLRVVGFVPADKFIPTLESALR
jgi:thiol:disulfide interchange protein DsbD